MKILVTGATGFLGGEVMRELRKKYDNSQLIGTGRDESRISKMKENGLKVIGGDLTSPGFVSSYFKDVTHVIHCAAKTSTWGNYQSFYTPNVLSTKNLLENIPGLVHFIYISTPCIYFDYSDRFNITEASPLPRRLPNNYAKTKYLGEQEVLAFPSSRMNRIILRPRAIMGAGDTSILPRVINAYKAGSLRIIGNGNTQCDFSSIRNLVQAVILALEGGPELNGRCFNITDGMPVNLWPLCTETLKRLGFEREMKKVSYPFVFTLGALFELWHKTLGHGEPPISRYKMGTLNYSMTFDITAAREILGYEPVVSTQESIDEFIAAYRHEGIVSEPAQVL